MNVGKAALAHDSADEDDELAELEDIMLARLQDSGITDINVEHVAATGAETAGDMPGEDAGPVERFLAEFERRYAGDDGYIVSVQLTDGSWINFGVPVTPAPLVVVAERAPPRRGGYRPGPCRRDLGASPPHRAVSRIRRRGRAPRARPQRRRAP